MKYIPEIIAALYIYLQQSLEFSVFQYTVSRQLLWLCLFIYLVQFSAREANKLNNGEIPTRKEIKLNDIQTILRS